MYLHIAPTRLVSDIQKEFTKEFPFLKLEFFSKRALSHSDYSASQIMPVHKRIGDIQSTLTDGEMKINGQMKVNELENRFKDEFNVAVQVFRKSGNIWLETTMTDNWTLEQQNKHGREISTNKADVPKTEDFDLSRDADH